MQRRPLGKTGIALTPIGFGAFKIGRNQGIKYAQSYALPNEAEVNRLLNQVLDLGINYIDTAPAYGFSEDRIGRAIAHRRHEFVVSTKVGEKFSDGRSVFNFSPQAIQKSIEQSLRRLQIEVLDLVFIHSSGDDLRIMAEPGAVEALQRLKAAGAIRAIGLSAKTVEGTRMALKWADAVMVEYHLQDRSQETVIDEAAERGVGIVVKKALASGHLDANDALRFVLGHAGVASAVVGTLNIEHLRANVAAAESCY